MKRSPTIALLGALVLLAEGAQAAGPVDAQGSWTTTLHARDLNGRAVALHSTAAAFYYDSTLDVTWLRQAAPSPQTLAAARSWADQLTVGAWNDWRLPTTLDTGHPGCTLFSFTGGDCGYNVPTQVAGAFSEMAHLFHVTLGNEAAYTVNGVFRGWAGQGVSWGLVNTAHFDGLQAPGFWSGNAIAGSPNYGWSFDLSLGLQSPLERNTLLHAMAVRDGDVLTAVPEPASGVLALFGLGSVLLARRARRARRT